MSEKLEEGREKRKTGKVEERERTRGSPSCLALPNCFNSFPTKAGKKKSRS